MKSVFQTLAAGLAALFLCLGPTGADASVIRSDANLGLGNDGTIISGFGSARPGGSLIIRVRAWAGLYGGLSTCPGSIDCTGTIDLDFRLFMISGGTVNLLDQTDASWSRVACYPVDRAGCTEQPIRGRKSPRINRRYTFTPDTCPTPSGCNFMIATEWQTSGTLIPWGRIYVQTRYRSLAATPLPAGSLLLMTALTALLGRRALCPLSRRRAPAAA